SMCGSWYKWASSEDIKSYNEECVKGSKNTNVITSYDIAKICSAARGCKKCELGKHYDEVCKTFIEQIKQARIPEDLYCIYLNQFKIGGKK
ncbi:MAG: hypothetical protein LIO87_05130, partial [Eubacterium sp.]|nr:hypothetical protein [Eubacterium sp.]